MPRLDNSSIVIIDSFDLSLRPDPSEPVDLCADCWLHKVIKVKLEDFEIDHPPYEGMGAYRCCVCGDPLTEDDNVY